ncbi:MAG: hypothetical protein CL609_12205 [Anaerolineaceae bacterium]|nr:hypothetical protein [Anaerolineaceae bacterium]
MSNTQGISAIPEWKQYLKLGEEILDQPSVELQCQTIQNIIKNLLGAKANLWLSEPYFPLPGENWEYPVLPKAETNNYVKKAYEQQLNCFEKGINQTQTIVDNKEKPYQVAIPLISQDNMLGILEVNRQKGPPFDHHELNFLEGLAAHSAVSMQIIRQVTIKNWRIEQLSLVRRVSEQITNVLDLEVLCNQITTLIRETFGYYYVAIFLVNGKKRTLELKANTGAESSNRLPSDFSIQMGEGIVGHVAKQGFELIAPNVKEEVHFREFAQLPETISEAAFPLKIDKKIIGVLDIQSDLPDAFHETDSIVLSALTNSIAVAVQNVYLYNSLKRRADQIASLFEIGHTINSSLNLDEVLEKTILSIKKRFDYDDIHLFTVHLGRRKVFYQTGTSAFSTKLHEEGFSFELDDKEGIIPWVARSGISAMTNNAAEDKRFDSRTLPPYNNLSELIVPLQYDGEVLGLLDIQSTKIDAFDEHDLFLFEALATTISSALRNAYLFRSEQWRRQVADSFRDVIGMISSDTAIDTLLQKILNQLNRNLPCDASAIWLLELDEETDQKNITPQNLKLAATWNVPKNKLINALHSSEEVWENFVSAMQSNGPSIRTANKIKGPLGIAMEYPDDYSSIAAPLKIGNQVFGLLTLAHKTARRYGNESSSITSTFANYAAVAIQNARLYADSQEQAWISTILLQVAQTCQRSESIDDLLESMVRLTPLLVGVKRCAFYLWEPFDEHLILKTQYGFNEHLPNKWEANVPAVFQMNHTQSPIFIQNAGEELNFVNTLVSEETGTLVLLPLIIRNELLGAFLVAHERTGLEGFQNRFSSQTLSILQGITQQTAMTIDNLSLIEARQEEAYVTAVLLQVAQAVVSLNKLEDVFSTIVNLLPILIGVDSCAIYLPTINHPDTFHPAGIYTHSILFDDLLYNPDFIREFPLFKFVQSKKKVGYAYGENLLNDFSDWENIPAHPYLEEEDIYIKSNMFFAFPIQIQDNLLGILLTFEKNIPKAYFEKRFELLRGVSQEIALAIQNHNLQLEMVNREKYERELQLSRQIQETFLPDHIPVYTGWEIEARWETALQVGGDFYDVIELPNNRLGLVIADVADKGFPAALYMTVSRTLIRAFGQTLNDPAGIFQSVNQLLVADTPNAMFITAVYIIVDLNTGELTYANAGHNLPFLFLAQENKVIELPKGSMALGVIEDITYHNEKISMQPGDILLLYTDGLSESFSRKETIFGTERVKSLISNCKDLSVKDMLLHLERELIEFRDGEPASDDLTLIAIKYLKN